MTQNIIRSTDEKGEISESHDFTQNQIKLVKLDDSNLKNETHSSSFLRRNQQVANPNRMFAEFIKEKDELEHSSAKRIMTSNGPKRTSKSKINAIKLYYS